VDFDSKFEMLFLYSPDASSFVCIEPWTKGMGAYATLKDSGWENGEKIPVIGPGEKVEYKAAFSVEKL
jgi:galactose mutarotase-like enzyme